MHCCAYFPVQFVLSVVCCLLSVLVVVRMQRARFSCATRIHLFEFIAFAFIEVIIARIVSCYTA